MSFKKWFYFHVQKLSMKLQIYFKNFFPMSINKNGNLNFSLRLQFRKFFFGLPKFNPQSAFLNMYNSQQEILYF